MISYESIFKNMGESARAASLVLQQLPEERINDVLRAMAQALVTHTDRILEANHKDMESARDVVPNTMLDRFLLSKDRIEQMAEGVRQVSLLASPVGSVLESINRPNGLHIEKRAVPFGVIGIIFEARPNVTVDAGALCLKPLMPLFYEEVKRLSIQIKLLFPLCKMYLKNMIYLDWLSN